MFNTVLNVVPQGKVAVVERFGEFHAAKQPGLFFAIPLVDRISYMVDMRETAVEINPQSAITKDNVSIEVSGNVYARFFDANKAAYGNSNPLYALYQHAQASMRAAIGKLEFDEILHARTTINASVASSLSTAAQPWGIETLRYEITAIQPGADIQRAMDKQAVAERDRREHVLAAEGTKRSEVLESEGVKIRKQNESEGELIKVRNEAQADKERQILEAEGEAQSMLAKAAAQAESIALIAQQLESPLGKEAAQLAVAKDYIEMYGAIGMSSNTMFFGSQPGDVNQLVAQAASVWKDSVASGDAAGVPK